MTLREFIELMENYRAATVAARETETWEAVCQVEVLECEVDAVLERLTKAPNYAVYWAQYDLI